MWNWKPKPADVYLVEVGAMPPPERQLLGRMKERRFYVLDTRGDIHFTADLFLFRTELKQHPDRLAQWLTGEFAAAGWFTKQELREQVSYLRRAFRRKEDNMLERRFMAGFSLAKGKYVSRAPKGYVWSDENDIWQYSLVAVILSQLF